MQYLSGSLRIWSVSFSFSLIARSLCQLGSIHNKLCPRNNGSARANIANIVHKFAYTKFAFRSVWYGRRGGLEDSLRGQEKWMMKRSARDREWAYEVARWIANVCSVALVPSTNVR